MFVSTFSPAPQRRDTKTKGTVKHKEIKKYKRIINKDQENNQ